MVTAKKNETETESEESGSLPSETSDKLYADLDLFSEKVIDLNYGFPLAMGWAAISSLLHLEETTEFLKKTATTKNEDGQEVSEIPIQLVMKFRKLSRRDSSSSMYHRRMPGFYITSIVEELDLYIGNIVETLLMGDGLDAKLNEKRCNL